VDRILAALQNVGALDAVVAGIDVVVHCASAPRGDQTITRNLIEAARGQVRVMTRSMAGTSCGASAGLPCSRE